MLILRKWNIQSHDQCFDSSSRANAERHHERGIDLTNGLKFSCNKEDISEYEHIRNRSYL